MEAREEKQATHVSRMINWFNIFLHAICPKKVCFTNICPQNEVNFE